MSEPPRSSSETNPAVLIVDADEDTRDLYRESFGRSGWSVEEASDGRIALVRAFAVKPSAIVSELRLPLIDGIALCEILRRDSSTSRVPIVVLTAEAHPEQLARARRAGASAILLKPSTPEIVVGETQRLIHEACASAVPSQDAVRCPTKLVTAHQRYWTTEPNVPAPRLACPICGSLLTYQQTFIGGVNRVDSERWDYYTCSQCGRFQYRWRSRKLRHVQ